MKTAKRDDIVNFCKKYLNVSSFDDHCENGLQIEGADKVSKIILGVSWSQKLIDYAISKKAEMILVHHGIFPKMIGNPPKIDGYMKGRLKSMLSNDISLVGFHLPLDAHPKIGNNISLCKLLGVKNLKLYDIGFIGNLEKACSLNDFVNTINKKLNTKSVVTNNDNRKIKKIAIVSGGAASWYQGAQKLGADVFVTGELYEGVVRSSEEENISVIGAGHYNTEKLGVQNLGKLLEKEFGIKSEFVDIPCEV